MARELSTGALLAVALLTVFAAPAAAEHEDATKIFETTLGDAPMPTTGYSAEDGVANPLFAERTVDTFEIPASVDYWYATATETHIVGTEVETMMYVTVADPGGGHSHVVDNTPSGIGAAVRMCDPVALACTLEAGSADDHWALEQTPRKEGTYELRFQGMTTAAYTIAVFGFQTTT